MFAAELKLKCSVILPVYARKEFVNQALSSLENQDIDKNFFEVLIISNIEIKLERSYNLNIQIVKSEQKPLAGKLAQGILMAKNEVITFLEDDDLYCKERISTVLRFFSLNNDLTYFHNGFIQFRHSKILKKEHKSCSQPSKHKIISTKESKISDISRVDEIYLYKRHADYNLSSIALRRSFIVRYVEMLSHLRSRYLDTFMFSIALYKGNLLMVDSKVLSLIRIHPANASQLVEASRKSSSNLGYSEDLGELIRVFNALKITAKSFVRNWITVRGFDDLMKSNNVSRNEATLSIIKLVKIYGVHFLSSDVAKKGIVYLISPRLMHKMLIEFHSTYFGN